MKTTRNSSTRSEACPWNLWSAPKNLVAREAGSRMRAPLNLERDSRTRAHARARVPHRRNRASSLRPTSRRDRAYAAHGCWVTSMKRRTKIVTAFFVRSSVYVAVCVLFLTVRVRSSRPLVALAPGMVGGRLARPASIGVHVEAAENNYDDRSAAGNHAGCCASRVEIERRAGKRSPPQKSVKQWKLRGRRNEKRNIVTTPAFTWNRSGQGQARDSTLASLIVSPSNYRKRGEPSEIESCNQLGEEYMYHIILRWFYNRRAISDRTTTSRQLNQFQR